MGNYVYSTMTADVDYVLWEFNPSRDVARVAKKVTIKGGTGVAQRRTFITPKGAATQVTDEELELLRANKVFQRQEQRGFLKVEKSMIEKSVNKAVKDMQSRDKSAPKTPKDYENAGLKVSTENNQTVIENTNKK